MVLGILIAVILGYCFKRFSPKKLKSATFYPYLSGVAWVLASVIGFFSITAMSASKPLSKAWFGPRNIDVTAPKWLKLGLDCRN